MAAKAEIKFQVLKNGQRVAYKWHRQAMRWVRVNLDTAKVLVATGQASAVK
jgi:hypothetical protein